MGVTNSQAAAFYFARKRNRNSRPMAAALQPRGLSVPEDLDVSSDVQVAQVASIMDHGQGENTITLSGPDAASFELDGRILLLKSGTSLSAGTPLVVSVDVSNDVKGDASAQFILTVT